MTTTRNGKDSPIRRFNYILRVCKEARLILNSSLVSNLSLELYLQNKNQKKKRKRKSQRYPDEENNNDIYSLVTVHNTYLHSLHKSLTTYVPVYETNMIS